MKYTYILYLLLLCTGVVMGQNCPEQGYDTNPDEPLLPSKSTAPWNENIGKFDWRTQNYQWFEDINNPSQSIVSPFRSYSNPNLQGVIEPADYLVADGWELISAQLGANLWMQGQVGTPNLSGKDHPGVILYNRYTGIMRIFVYVNGSVMKDDYQTGRIKLGHKVQGENHINALLSFTESLVSPLDNFSKEVAFTTINTVKSNSGFWIVGDFPLAYDPCVCNFESELRIDVELIKEASIKIEGNIGSSIPQIDITGGNNNNGALGASVSQGTFGTSSAVEDLDEVIGDYDLFRTRVISMFKRASDTKKIIDNYYALDDIKFKTTAFSGKGTDVYKKYKGLTNSIPYVDAMVFLLDMMIGQPSKPSVSKVSFDVGFLADGTISSTQGIETFYTFTPGSALKSNLTPENPKHPMYNEALGVFNLIETPEIEYVTYWHVDEDRDGRVINRSEFPTIHQYKIKKGIRYALNPASQLEVDDIEVALMLRYPNVNPEDNLGNGMKNRLFYDATAIPNSNFEIPLNVNPSGNTIANINNTGRRFVKNFLFKDIQHLSASGFGVELMDENLADPKIFTTLNAGGYLPINCFEELSFFTSRRGSGEAKEYLNPDDLEDALTRNIPIFEFFGEIWENLKFDLDLVPKTPDRPIMFVKVNVTLKRKDDPNAEKIKLVLPYKVKVSEAHQSKDNIYFPQLDGNNIKQFGFTSSLNSNGTVYPYDVKPVSIIFGGSTSIGNIVGPGIIEATNSITIDDNSIILPNTIIRAPEVNIAPSVEIPADVTIEAGLPISTCGNESFDELPYYITDFTSICSNEDKYNPSVPLKRGKTNGVASKNDINTYVFPNPFKDNFEYSYTLTENEEVSVSISNSIGEQIDIIVNNKIQNEGKHKIIYNGSNLTPGVYFITVNSKSFKQTIKLVKQ